MTCVTLRPFGADPPRGLCFTMDREGRISEGFNDPSSLCGRLAPTLLEACFLQWIVKVGKERASQMIVILRPFAHGWPGALFFTKENEGRKREGFKNDRISPYGSMGRTGIKTSHRSHFLSWDSSLMYEVLVPRKIGVSGSSGRQAGHQPRGSQSTGAW